MGQLLLGDINLDLPGNWGVQGMVTLTLPSTDKKVRPNIIVTVERVAPNTDLPTYYDKIKQSIVSRGIKSFEVVDEFEFDLSGVAAMQLVCRWDLSAMKSMAKPGQNLDHIEDGQMVQQIQVTLLHGEKAVNFTASFPEEQFDLYARPFEKFINSLKLG